MIKDIKRLINYGKVEKKKIFLIFILLFWNAIFSYLLPNVSLSIYDNAIGNRNAELLIKMLLLYILLIGINNFLVYALNKNYINFGNNLVYNLRMFLINHVLGLDGDFFCNCKAGDLINTIYEDTTIVKNFIITNFFRTISDLCMGIPIALIILIIQPQLFLEMLLLQPIIYFMQFYFSKKTYALSKRVRSDSAKANVSLQECINNLLTISQCGISRYFVNKADTELKNLKHTSEKLDTLSVAKNISLNCVLAIWTITMLGFGGYKVIKGEMTIGELLVLTQYSPKLFLPITSVLTLRVEEKRVRVSIERLNMLMQTESKIIGGDKTSGINENTNNDICFSAVTFTYGTQDDILENLDFKVESGSFCALIGSSGSGKSTIVNMLIRLWNPQNGIIKIGCEKIENYSIEYLRNQIGIVSQNIVLVNGSILDNISLGKQYTIEEINRVINICGLQDFITNLKEGIYAQIGDNGIKISGGQKQRMQIARMLLKRTPILILDEATSALDGVIENQIISKIKELPV